MEVGIAMLDDARDREVLPTVILAIPQGSGQGLPKDFAEAWGRLAGHSFFAMGSE